MKTTPRIVLALTVLATIGSPIQAAQKIDLRFRPTPADKQTLRVTSTLEMSIKMGTQQQDLTNTMTITLAFEPAGTADDGTVLVRVRFVAIRQKGGMKGAGPGVEYDSTKPQDPDDPMAGHYSAFIGAGFPIKVSPHGEIVEMGTDELFLAVAGNLMEREDKMMRERLKERADQAIERANQRFGSREGRKQALKKQVEAFPLLNAKAIQGLLESIIVRFPKDPVPTGGSWEAPVAPIPSMPFEMTAAHALKAMTPDACTIEIKGQRTMQDPPIISQVGPTQTSMKLAGAYTATARVNSRTGLLLSKQAQMKFTGETQSPTPQGKSETMQTAMEGTTTVEAVE
jgi:hypothetical protein